MKKKVLFLLVVTTISCKKITVEPETNTSGKDGKVQQNLPLSANVDFTDTISYYRSITMNFTWDANSNPTKINVVRIPRKNPSLRIDTIVIEKAYQYNGEKLEKETTKMPYGEYRRWGLLEVAETYSYQNDRLKSFTRNYEYRYSQGCGNVGCQVQPGLTSQGTATSSFDYLVSGRLRNLQIKQAVGQEFQLNVIDTTTMFSFTLPNTMTFSRTYNLEKRTIADSENGVYTYATVPSPFSPYVLSLLLHFAGSEGNYNSHANLDIADMLRKYYDKIHAPFAKNLLIELEGRNFGNKKTYQYRMDNSGKLITIEGDNRIIQLNY